ncbi:2OG-Fe(II) oxygenase [Zopfia rhizophila CBS 207.26]|uniref:2OG-Fe(II) oxygenase n=1 Tax=Zopfia rhizophila CBS 207.26 TaxID=1314779 RepID=A0A6A6DY20_9PEZI|nr:2OG-Fe(II) oxygenase [Zopfia rhizophila CBS 207.26]
MTTSFSSLPIVDVGALNNGNEQDLASLSKTLYSVFTTTGFAYLINVPFSFDHDEIFQLARDFFGLPLERKMRLAKKSFRSENDNTYRGYFPTQPLTASDNLKEGFEIGSPRTQPVVQSSLGSRKINLSEPNVWPNEAEFPSRSRLEQIYDELQTFASQLLSLLAVSLGKDRDYFSSWLQYSLSTLRLLHYPIVPQGKLEYAKGDSEDNSVKLSCTPHTDSGILTLLHQDATPGLEVLNASGQWVPAPYVPGSIIVNIGDLMAKVSGGRFTATMHRVRSPPPKSTPQADACSRFSIPFFFEPGEMCIVRPLNGGGEAVAYGEHVRKKMSTWVEFQDDSGYDTT